MERVQVRLPDEDLERIGEEVKKGRYPNKSEAIRDKLRKSYILEAMVNMRNATEGLDREEMLKQLEETREEMYAEEQREKDSSN